MRLGAGEQRFERRVVEPPQDEDLRPRQQRPVQLEGRVLGRRADQDHGAVLDIGQKSVLLRPVKAVDLIDEQQRAEPRLAAFSRRLEDFAQIGDPGKHRRQLLEGEIGALREAARSSSCRARRPPQDHRREPPARDHAPDRPFRTEQMILPDNFGKALRAQQIGQRPRRLRFEKRVHLRLIWDVVSNAGLDSGRRACVAHLDPERAQFVRQPGVPAAVERAAKPAGDLAFASIAPP